LDIICKLRSNHVYIRPFELNDRDTKSLLNFRLTHREFFKPYEPVQQDEHFTRTGQEEVIQKAIQNWEDGLAYSFGIFLGESDALIGKVSLSNVSRGAWQNCTIGYSLAEKVNGRGYTTEAVSLAVKFALEGIGLHRVQAAVMPHNLGSIRVLEKVGFRHEGLSKRYLNINGSWEDHVIYAITREDWRGVQ
jgi:[ribosomal protein S5]-alanine N-acetyltransferase